MSAIAIRDQAGARSLAQEYGGHSGSVMASILRFLTRHQIERERIIIMKVVADKIPLGVACEPGGKFLSCVVHA